MSFTLIHVVFNILSVVSFLCVFLLFLIYQRVGGNVLLRSCSVMILLMLTAVLIGSAVFNNDMAADGKEYCRYQAFILNYCVISVHGLIACMMFDAWSHVSNWRPRKQKIGQIGRRRAFSPGYIFCSFILPLVPTIILIIITTALYKENPEDGLIQENTYYCYISTNNTFHFLTHTGWIMLYSLIGIFCSVYLLLKTVSTRQKSKKSGRTTHLTLLSIVRVAAATLIYLTITFATIIPIFTDPCPLKSDSPKLSNLTKNPFQNPNLCQGHHTFGDERIYWAYLRCPKLHREFLPCLIGMGFFFMYGFGKHAKKAYIDIYRRCRDCTSIFACIPKRKSTDNQLLEYTHDDNQASQDVTHLDSASYDWDGNMRDWYEPNISGDDVPLHLIDALALPTSWYNYYDTQEPIDESEQTQPEPLVPPISHNLLQFTDLPPHMRIAANNIPIPTQPEYYRDESIDSSIEYRTYFSKSCPY